MPAGPSLTSPTDQMTVLKPSYRLVQKDSSSSSCLFPLLLPVLLIPKRLSSVRGPLPSTAVCVASYLSLVNLATLFVSLPTCLSFSSPYLSPIPLHHLAFSFLLRPVSPHLCPLLLLGVCSRLVDLLNHPSNLVQTPALRAVGNIVTGDASICALS